MYKYSKQISVYIRKGKHFVKKKKHDAVVVEKIFVVTTWSKKSKKKNNFFKYISNFEDEVIFKLFFLYDFNLKRLRPIKN